MTKKIDFVIPFYLKLSLLILGLIGLFHILFVGRPIIIPLVLAVLFSILLNPVVMFMVRHKVNRVVAILLTVFLMFLLATGFIYFISSQFSMFQETFPQVREKLDVLVADGSAWISNTFNVSQERISNSVNSARQEWFKNSGALLGQTFTTIGGLLAVFLLMPIYIFMFLFYKPLLLDFIARLCNNNDHGTVSDILNESKGMIQSYLVGLLIEAAIVAVLDIGALLALGIQYAVLLGLLGALLNMIPYVGTLVATILPMMIAFATKSPLYALFVLIAFLVIQFIDNNFIVPKIVASRVKVNALVSIIVVLIGGAIWGIAGMFLALPLVAIAKVIFDRVEGLQPWGFLIGDTMPQIGGDFFQIKRGRRKKKVED